jgi:hypothetical protein
MPNWCSNILTIRSEDTAFIDRIEAAYEQGELLKTLKPEPEYPGYSDTEIKERDSGSHMPDWWNWRVANWGTKWDVGGDDCDSNRIDKNTITFYFDSAWAPPLQALEGSEGFDYEIQYYEPGMSFVGEAHREGDSGFDVTYEIGEQPDHLTELFNIVPEEEEPCEGEEA